VLLVVRTSRIKGHYRLLPCCTPLQALCRFHSTRITHISGLVSAICQTSRSCIPYNVAPPFWPSVHSMLWTLHTAPRQSEKIPVVRLTYRYMHIVLAVSVRLHVCGREGGKEKGRKGSSQINRNGGESYMWICHQRSERNTHTHYTIFTWNTHISKPCRN